jgi:hypothetical protein
MFEDIIGRINYTKLYDIHTTVAPIRGHKVYPLGFRKYSARHFTPRNDGSYELWYWNLSSKNITEAEKMSPLAVVHPDNTFEITSTRTMYQSDYWMLNAGMQSVPLWATSTTTLPVNGNPLISTSVKYGGEYLQYENQRRLPLFKGMRWNLDTGKFHDDHGFTVRKWVVDRKLSDGIRKRYADQIKACKVMVRQFDEKSFIRFVNDIAEDAEAFVKPHFDKVDIQMHYAHGMVWDKLKWGGISEKLDPITNIVRPHVMDMANKDLLGALYTYAIYKGVSGISRMRSYPEWALRRLVESGDYEFEFILNKFFYELINEEDAFKAITYECNDPQASLGKWGCEIELANGSIVQQL